MSQSTRSGSTQRTKPSFGSDNKGWYITVACGSLTGQLYVNKLDESKKILDKCILAKGSWYSPPEFEVLGGMKSKKWRYSLLHKGRPLHKFDFSCPNPPSGASVPVTMLPPHTGTSPLSSTDNTVHSPASTHESHLVNPVLSFIKAFRLKSDKDNLKRAACSRFSGAAIDNAKKDFWRFCSDMPTRANMPYQARRDSDNRSQMAADIEDLVRGFDALDASDSIPPIYCEANDLLLLPSLSLDPTAEQVQHNTDVLKALISKIENLEKMLSSSKPMPPPPSTSFAEAASKAPTNAAAILSTRGPSVSSNISDSRACNLVLFGLPESDSILELKSDIDKLLEYLIGKSVKINDVFRLGKYSASSKRPTPVLIKLETGWDRKIILLNKRKLNEYSTPRLFLREDVPPNQRLRQKVERPSSNDAEPLSAGDKSSASEKPLVTSDSLHPPEMNPPRSDSPSRRSLSAPMDPASVQHTSSPSHVQRSTLPPLSQSSFISTCTVLQGCDPHNGST